MVALSRMLVVWSTDSRLRLLFLNHRQGKELTMSKAFSYRNEASLKTHSKHNLDDTGLSWGPLAAKAATYLSSQDSVLYIKCGTGKPACDIARYVKQIIGIDKASETVGLANWRAEQARLSNAHFQVADIFDEKVSGLKFDAIVAFDALDLTDNPTEVMSKLNQLLSCDGKLLLSYSCLGEGQSFFRNVRTLLARWGLATPCRHLSVAELENLVTGASFFIEEGGFSHQVTSEYFIVATKQ